MEICCVCRNKKIQFENLQEVGKTQESVGRFTRRFRHLGDILNVSVIIKCLGEDHRITSAVTSTGC